MFFDQETRREKRSNDVLEVFHKFNETQYDVKRKIIFNTNCPIQLNSQEEYEKRTCLYNRNINKIFIPLKLTISH